MANKDSLLSIIQWKATDLVEVAGKGSGSQPHSESIVFDIFVEVAQSTLELFGHKLGV